MNALAIYICLARYFEVVIFVESLFDGQENLGYRVFVGHADDACKGLEDYLVVLQFACCRVGIAPKLGHSQDNAATIFLL